jgi:hypothetical protein
MVDLLSLEILCSGDKQSIQRLMCNEHTYHPVSRLWSIGCTDDSFKLTTLAKYSLNSPSRGRAGHLLHCLSGQFLQNGVDVLKSDDMFISYLVSSLSVSFPVIGSMWPGYLVVVSLPASSPGRPSPPLYSGKAGLRTAHI